MLALIRLTEPSVAKSLKKKISKTIKNLTCDKSQTKKAKPTPFDRPDLIEENDYVDGNLNSFLTSSLNVELVYTILTTISNFMSMPQ